MSEHPLATAAGLAVLDDGGNAADAAVATILVLCVTDDPICVFGGEVPIVVYNAKRNTVEVLCGLGTAPKLGTRDYYAKRGGIGDRKIAEWIRGVVRETEDAMRSD